MHTPSFVSQVFDNGGKTTDRYTVIVAPGVPDLGGAQLCMSTDPDSPQGVSQWCHGSSIAALGKEINWADLPDNVRRHVVWRWEN